MIEIPKKEPLNIVPFIDIMLVLLAMVLSISTFIARGEIEVDLPKSETAGAAAADKPRLVSVDSAGVLHLDGEKLDPAALEAFIESVPREQRIVLRIDKNARFEHFIGVVDLLKKHRHENFAIAAEKVNAASR